MNEVLKPLEGKRIHVAFRRYIRFHTVVSDFDPKTGEWEEDEPPCIVGDMISMRVLAADGYLRKVGSDGSLLFDIRIAYYHPEDVKVMSKLPEGTYVQKGALLGEPREQLLCTTNDEVLSMSVGQGDDQTYYEESDFPSESAAGAS
jgi:hypothetical protein